MRVKQILFADLLCFMLMMTSCSVTTLGAAKQIAGDFTSYQNLIYPDAASNQIYFLTNGDQHDTDPYVVKRLDTVNGAVSVAATLPQSYKRSYWHINEWLYYIDTANAYQANTEAELTVRRLNLHTGEQQTVFTTTLKDETPKAIGVDQNGRIYIGTEFKNRILVFNGSGMLLAQSSDNIDEYGIEEFCGFDTTNGNIYFRGGMNWHYWGYDHEMAALKVARLNGSSINGNPLGITYLYQQYYEPYYGGVSLFANRYLAELSSFAGNTLYILDSSKISPSNVIQSATSIFLTGGISVSPVNLSNADDVLQFGVQAAVSESGDLAARDKGPLCAYSGASGGLLAVKTDEKELSVYSMAGKLIGKLSAEHRVFDVLSVNGRITVLEAEGGTYYVESFDLKNPERITIHGKGLLTVGDSTEYTAQIDSQMKVETVFSSSDDKILSVDERGNASAWTAGTVDVSVKTADGRLSDIIKVTVGEGRSASGSLNKSDGQVTDNSDMNNYITYGSTVGSYLVPLTADSFMRVEGIGKNTILIEYMNRYGKVTSKKTIAGELEFFGGFYAGHNAYYLVYGADNPKETDDKEVMRVVRYSKNWIRQSACSVKGSNTYKPFDAGSLRMTEFGDTLYIHTCHVMYKSSDELHHQANMTFEISESTMTLKDSFTEVSNLSEGYVSHSFSQFIQTDGKLVYRVDHGDAYPRGIALTAYPVNGKMTQPVIMETMVSFEGTTGDNSTGASIGGFELSATNAVAALNKAVSTAYNAPRNIVIASYDINAGKSQVIPVTSYTKKDQITCGTPQLVKIDPVHFLLMWMEMNTAADTTRCGMVQLNNTGKPVSGIVYKNIELSDCQPIVTSDGMICWYVTNGKQTRMYRVNPFKLELTKENPISVSISEKHIILKIGEKKKLTAKIKSVHAVSDLIWSTDSSKIVSVNHNGEITALKEGTANIMVVTDNDLKAVCKVTVKADSSNDKEEISSGNTKTPAARVEKIILKSKKEEAPSGSVYALLQLQVKKVSKSSVTLSWTKIKNASGYTIYGSKCGGTYQKIKKLKASKTSCKISKLKSGTYYKYLIIATGRSGGSEVCLASSKTVHVATEGGKYGNDKSVKIKNVKNGSLKLKKGKTFTLKVKATAQKTSKPVKKHRAVAFESTNKSVASVGKTGKITARGKGSCYIYTYAQNGVSAKVKVTVQ